MKFYTPVSGKNGLELHWYTRGLLFLYCKASLFISVGGALSLGIMLESSCLTPRTLPSANVLWTSDHFQELWGSYASSYLHTHFILSQHPSLKQQSRPLSTGRCISMNLFHRWEKMTQRFCFSQGSCLWLTQERITREGSSKHSLLNYALWDRTKTTV